MAAIPAELVESWLFGRKGAFTGADTRKEGRFSQAEGGTLFLDEIGDMPLSTQTDCFACCRRAPIHALGFGRTSRKCSVIAATHRDLEAMVASGEFRQDCFIV